MNIFFRLSYLAFSMGYAEDYEVEVLAGRQLVGVISFEHRLLDDSERRLDDPEDEDISAVDVTARLGPAATCFPASELRLLADATAYLMNEVERRDREVIENLFGGQGGTLEWVNPPAWLIQAVKRSVIERPKLREAA